MVQHLRTFPGDPAWSDTNCLYDRLWKVGCKLTQHRPRILGIQTFRESQHDRVKTALRQHGGGQLLQESPQHHATSAQPKTVGRTQQPLQWQQGLKKRADVSKGRAGRRIKRSTTHLERLVPPLQITHVRLRRV